MFVVAGLGNPGLKYAGTRHNAGFDAVSLLAQSLGVKIRKAAHHALIAETTVAGRKVILALPQTYMNESGRSIKSLLDYYRLDPSGLIVVYDDVDLEPGRIRVRGKGGAGTHNGMRSIIYHIESEDFPRVRIGIGERPEHFELADYVLSRYSKDELEKVISAYKAAAEAVTCIIADGVSEAQARFNGHNGVDL
ncbi:MAG: aminoacyl-tRNA hydrolase [Christensenellales bacterium]|jgi:PTH1 family peptidyl-tRNA hydrolase